MMAAICLGLCFETSSLELLDDSWSGAGLSNEETSDMQEVKKSRFPPLSFSSSASSSFEKQLFSLCLVQKCSSGALIRPATAGMISAFLHTRLSMLSCRPAKAEALPGTLLPESNAVKEVNALKHPHVTVKKEDAVLDNDGHCHLFQFFLCLTFAFSLLHECRSPKQPPKILCITPQANHLCKSLAQFRKGSGKCALVRVR
ncbi:hypothetical protein DNTS_009352 [Danionella cerebrum]|uniref:Uncharacterized protein n=1 Tax=Danionella cerebrum TaxID=2873325 RepID=A0A553QK81_9TELE|nr:hypothetical protein DNTS_009352 [Danionella translucida]